MFISNCLNFDLEGSVYGPQRIDIKVDESGFACRAFTAKELLFVRMIENSAFPWLLNEIHNCCINAPATAGKVNELESTTSNKGCDSTDGAASNTNDSTAKMPQHYLQHANQSYYLRIYSFITKVVFNWIFLSQIQKNYNIPITNKNRKFSWRKSELICFYFIVFFNLSLIIITYVFKLLQ